tara:strand:+ start:2419 stop:2619 length:201 start_codon:yes stop_codon:yes gene_type:complete
MRFAGLLAEQLEPLIAATYKSSKSKLDGARYEGLDQIFNEPLPAGRGFTGPYDQFGNPTNIPIRKV